MKILTLSGSVRAASTNSILLNTLQQCAPLGMKIEHYLGIGVLPIFNPDFEGSKTPDKVLSFCSAIENADGVLIASPEYVRAIPGGLKNAIDWLVSREEIMSKPIALAHGTYRGDDMLDFLRKVLETVSDRFSREIFLRIPLNSTIPVTTESVLADKKNRLKSLNF